MKKEFEYTCGLVKMINNRYVNTGETYYNVELDFDNKLAIVTRQERPDYKTIVNAPERRVIKVVEDKNRKYTYQVQKTQIKAINGINGLDKFFSDDCFTDYIRYIVNGVIDNKYGKEVI